MNADKSDYQPYFDEDFLHFLTTNHDDDEEEETLSHHQMNPPNNFLASSSDEIIMMTASSSSEVIGGSCNWEVPGRSSSPCFDMLPNINGSEEKTKMGAPDGQGQGVGFKIAFRTKSDIEVLDDGFRWRKYGKKKVKNSPNPRNYYRCSTGGCNVKKRVEREREDPSFVITTYEGKHNHQSPLGSSSGISHKDAIDPPHKLQLLHHHQL